MTEATAKTGLIEKPPAVTWVYGLLGLIPFLTGAVTSLPGPLNNRGWADDLLIVYGALILSFLGGARWGLEIRRTSVRPSVISASMIPTLAAFAILLAAPWVADMHWGYVAMAAAFAAQWVWDVGSEDVPTWYPRLRRVLSSGAVISLLVAALPLATGRHQMLV